VARCTLALMRASILAATACARALENVESSAGASICTAGAGIEKVLQIDNCMC